ncbi:hypothetical protein CC78DRAFT_567816 [Lojkania enalia]|uniref:Uncharacterized protein n=1 Tax=Lojkania enalia TaxID=147567 RepID=A0A9P4N410_9PLEO|nr:hypothetical protein CC78DRAFT_567816 [Didymosphaeria enalia]
MALPVLAPVPQPGLMLFPSFIAQRLETFFFKEMKSTSKGKQCLISFQSAHGPAFLQVNEENRKTMVFRMMNGKEVMTIVKQEHHWSGKRPEYHAYSPEGTRIWHLILKGSFKTEYRLSLFPQSPQPLFNTEVSKVFGGNLGILVLGNPAMVATKPNAWKSERENYINIAPGMDILLALGVNWIRFDKQEMDRKGLTEAAGEVGGAIAA